MFAFDRSPWPVLAGLALALFGPFFGEHMNLEVLLAERQAKCTDWQTADAFPSRARSMEAPQLHDDFVFIDRTGAILGKAEYLASATRRGTLRSVTTQDVRVHRLPGVTLLQGVLVETDRENVRTKLRYTDVHINEGGGWRLVSSQLTPIGPDIPENLLPGAAIEPEIWLGTDPIGDEETVLRQLNDNYVNAFRHADVSWYAAHLAPDYVVVNGDGSFTDRMGALARFSRPVFATHFESFPVDHVRVRRFGDIALIHAQNAYRMKDGREGIDRYTDIWHKRDGRWLCIAAHITVHHAAAHRPTGVNTHTGTS